MRKRATYKKLNESKSNCIFHMHILIHTHTHTYTLGSLFDKKKVCTSIQYCSSNIQQQQVNPVTFNLQDTLVLKALFGINIHVCMNVFRITNFAIYN